MAKKNLLEGPDIFTPPSPPDKCANVVVIKHNDTYRGVVRGHAKQNGVIRYVLVDPGSWSTDQWESVHDVFEVE